MVGRTDSLQTAPNLHDRMWELDGFGDYVKHSFHFQFIVQRRGITFTQMVRNLERHSFCATQNVHGKGGISSKTKLEKRGFQHFIFFKNWLSAACLYSWVKRTLMLSVMVRLIFYDFKTLSYVWKTNFPPPVRLNRSRRLTRCLTTNTSGWEMLMYSDVMSGQVALIISSTLSRWHQCRLVPPKRSDTHTHNNF